MIKHYNTLTEAIEAHTPSEKPDQSATKIIRHLAANHPTATHAVLFVNQDFGSSMFGAWTVVPVGPNNTYHTVDDLASGHLFDLPSQRQYPVAFTELEAARGLQK